LTYAPPVMPGPVPGIPTGTGNPKVAATPCNGSWGDGRDKPGHDGLGVRQSFGRLVLYLWLQPTAYAVVPERPVTGAGAA